MPELRTARENARLEIGSQCGQNSHQIDVLGDSPVNRGTPCSETPLPRTMGTYRNAGGRGLYT